MTELTIGLIVTGGLLVAVFLGVRVFAAAALAGLVGMVWAHRLEGGGPASSERFRTRSRSTTC